MNEISDKNESTLGREDELSTCIVEEERLQAKALLLSGEKERGFRSRMLESYKDEKIS